MQAALESGRPILPLYILDETPGLRPLGSASRWWLHHSLAALSSRIERLGGKLLLRRGPAAPVLQAVAAGARAEAVYWNRCYEPSAIARDTAIKTRLGEAGIQAESRNAALLAEPWTLKTRAGEPFKVFTPFWRTLSGGPEPEQPKPAPRTVAFVAAALGSDRLEDWGLLPVRPNWAKTFTEHWQPGETGAAKRLAKFLVDGIADYAAARDRPDRTGTARLSPHLHFGEIGPRQIWHGVRAAAAAAGSDAERGADSFLRELGWREFTHHLLFHWPELPTHAWRPQFENFPWREDAAGLRAWQQGRTGYPIVDAGMTELWRTGWMHNRVRMIVASFLIKDLLIDWRDGESWFWDTLVDADLAQNAASWQWVAGSGADAVPYFRVFNPVLQGENFDPEGGYVRRWLPALARLPNAYLHKPWQAPPAILAAAGVGLGVNYPAPILDHAAARGRALAAFRGLESGTN